VQQNSDGEVLFAVRARKTAMQDDGASRIRIASKKRTVGQGPRVNLELFVKGKRARNAIGGYAEQ
jgi:hypothetical protein